jgi:hypothetical protein
MNSATNTGLAEDAGLIEARVYFRDISDAIDKLPLPSPAS